MGRGWNEASACWRSGEALIVSPIPDAATITKIEDYLCAKWALTKQNLLAATYSAASVLQHNASGTDHNAFPSIVVCANGDLLINYRKGVDHSSVDGIIITRRSTDGGISWGGEVTVLSSASWDYRDAGMTRLSDNSLIMLVGKRDGAGANQTTGVTVIKSTDNGITWSAEVAVTNNYTGWARAGYKVVELADGTLLAPMYGRDAADTDAQLSIRVEFL